ncbi:TPA: ATP-binding protein [Vibrio mimicus]
MRPHLTLIRGLPGSGKSTLAKTLPAIHLEADMYFVNEHGEYHFRPERLAQAHQWCQEQTEYWLQQGKHVVVSNTFVRHWEMAAYRKLARRYQAKLTILVCRESYQNVHGVDVATVERMRQQWQE